jgi:hypothetical protein
MKDDPAEAQVSSLHRLRDLDDSLAANLMALSAEVAATVGPDLVDRPALSAERHPDVA